MDVLPESVAEVQQKFADHPNLRSVVADISDPAVLRQIDRNSVDTVVCINVLEHIQHDAAALRHMFEALKPGGHLLLYVPAGQYLFGHLDQALGHFRRYSLETLRDLAQAQGFEAIEIAYMNVAAIPGWFLSSRVLRREAPPRSLLWLFNLLTPALVLVEGILRPPFGQSLVLIGRRP
jgi:SAM-dependent methyltransferase